MTAHSVQFFLSLCFSSKHQSGPYNLKSWKQKPGFMQILYETFLLLKSCRMCINMYAILAICSRQIQSPAESPDQIRSLVEIALWCLELSFLLYNLLDNIPFPACLSSSALASDLSLAFSCSKVSV